MLLGVSPAASPAGHSRYAFRMLFELWFAPSTNDHVLVPIDAELPAPDRDAQLLALFDARSLDEAQALSDSWLSRRG